MCEIALLPALLTGWQEAGMHGARTTVSLGGGLCGGSFFGWLAG